MAIDRNGAFAGSIVFCIFILCTNVLYPSKGTCVCCNVQSNFNHCCCSIGTANPSREILSWKVRYLLKAEPYHLQVLALSRFIEIFCLLCSLVGAILVIAGLYIVLWGKSKDDKLVASPEKHNSANGSSNNIDDWNIGINQRLLQNEASH